MNQHKKTYSQKNPEAFVELAKISRELYLATDITVRMMEKDINRMFSVDLVEVSFWVFKVCLLISW